MKFYLRHRASQGRRGTKGDRVQPQKLAPHGSKNLFSQAHSKFRSKPNEVLDASSWSSPGLWILPLENLQAYGSFPVKFYRPLDVSSWRSTGLWKLSLEDLQASRWFPLKIYRPLDASPWKSTGLCMLPLEALQASGCFPRSSTCFWMLPLEALQVSGCFPRSCTCLWMLPLEALQASWLQRNSRRSIHVFEKEIILNRSPRVKQKACFTSSVRLPKT